MSPPNEAARPGARLWVMRVCLRLLVCSVGALMAVLMAVLLVPTIAQAGTVTIVDGPNTSPINGVYTDGYIEAKLASTSLTITTTGTLIPGLYG